MCGTWIWMNRSRLSLVSLAVLVALASSCADKREAAGRRAPLAEADLVPAYGDALIQGSIGDASTMIAMLASDSSSRAVIGHIFDGLLTYDKDLKELEPRLAEGWEVSPDGLQITFKLRKDVRWQDGKPFTVHDIKFGFDLIRDPATLTSYAEDFKQVEHFEILDDHSFRVTYDKPFAPALASWGSLVVLPRHLLEGQDINTSPFARNPVGLGAYKFEAWETGSEISVLSNYDYYRGRPYVERVVWRVIPDLQTQFLELNAGSLDTMGLTPVQFERQTSSAQFNEMFRKYTYVANGYTYLGYNLENPLFADKRVRRALTHAINKQELVDAVLLGLGQPTDGPYKPGTRWVNQDLEPLAFDPEKSRQLLAEAGWVDTDGDGVVDKDGRPFAFTIITNNGNESRQKTAIIVQRRFKDIGVDASIRPLEWAAFINDYIDKRRFEAVILGWSSGPDPDLYDVWHSSKTEGKHLNFISFKNVEADRMLERGRRTFDNDERKRYYDRLQEILHEEQPYSFLYVPHALVAVSSRFYGIEPAAAGISHNFERWFVPAELQKHTISQGP